MVRSKGLPPACKVSSRAGTTQLKPRSGKERDLRTVDEQATSESVKSSARGADFYLRFATVLVGAVISWIALPLLLPGAVSTPLIDRLATDLATEAEGQALSRCSGYEAHHVVQTASSLTADLRLAGPACNVYGEDIRGLKLLVEYQTDKRLHVKIYDTGLDVFQVQEAILPLSKHNAVPSSQSDIQFSLVKKPFSFAVARSKTGEVIFNTSGTPLIFETQYVRLRTSLPDDPNLYGLGEHADSFRLETNGYRRTFWNSDSFFMPQKASLYGSHPIYFDHRGMAGTHGVFLRSSSGMDVNIDRTPEDGQYLEYATIGGVLDLYFLAGPNPSEVSRQYAEVVGLSAMYPYWALGVHQCKYGYWDVYELAEVVANSSEAGIPLDVLWSDIDSMDLRRDFTLDEERFPMHKMRLLIDTLHRRGQKFITMVDAGVPRMDYPPYNRGNEKDAFLKAEDGSNYLGVQWPGVVAWPDWFAPETQEWWTDEIVRWFDPETGMDVDGLWNDMNEASNFCPNVSCIPEEHARYENAPPPPTHSPRPDTGRPIPGFPPEFQPGGRGRQEPGLDKQKRYQHSDGQERLVGVEAVEHTIKPINQVYQAGQMKGLPGRNLFEPPYKIHNLKGALSDKTLYTNITNYDGTSQYDTHNAWGTMMAEATRNALQARRPGLRPFVLTRSTFAGTGRVAAHWFGDNLSTWAHYRLSIAQMLSGAAVQQMPLVGSDVCGFNGDTWPELCARWVLMAAFQPFLRNHADLSSAHQEFYRWGLTAAAARKAFRARYALLDYIYTALARQAANGEPLAKPLWFAYPSDPNTAAVETQWLLGDALLVSPVVDDDSKEVTLYLPDDVFYDFWTLEPVRGAGANVTLTGLGWTDIPVHVRGGSVVPLRARGDVNTTAQLRLQDFSVLVAPGPDGMAAGSLYLDDGESVDAEERSTTIEFSWDGSSFAATSRRWGYATDLVVERVVIAGQDGEPADAPPGTTFDAERGAVVVPGPWGLEGSFGFKLKLGRAGQQD